MQEHPFPPLEGTQEHVIEELTPPTPLLKRFKSQILYIVKQPNFIKFIILILIATTSLIILGKVLLKSQKNQESPTSKLPNETITNSFSDSTQDTIQQTELITHIETETLMISTSSTKKLSPTPTLTSNSSPNKSSITPTTSSQQNTSTSTATSTPIPTQSTSNPQPTNTIQPMNIQPTATPTARPTATLTPIPTAPPIPTNTPTTTIHISKVLVDVYVFTGTGNSIVSNAPVKLINKKTNEVFTGFTDIYGQSPTWNISENTDVEIYAYSPRDWATKYCGSMWSVNTGYYGTTQHQHITIFPPGQTPCYLE